MPHKSCKLGCQINPNFVVNLLYKRLIIFTFTEKRKTLFLIAFLQFLTKDPSKRLGSEDKGGESAILTHPYYLNKMDWDALINQQVTPPFKPIIVSRTIYSVGQLPITKTPKHSRIGAYHPLSFQRLDYVAQ